MGSLRERDREYKAYLASSRWRQLRIAALERAHHRCQICNRDGYGRLEVHHRTYERFGGDELLEDLTVLCHRCHRRAHGKRGVSTPNLYKKIDRASRADLPVAEVLKVPCPRCCAGPGVGCYRGRPDKFHYSVGRLPRWRALTPL